MSFRTILGPLDQVLDELNGTAALKKPFPIEGLPLGALTLKFKVIAVTVTFPGSAGDLVTAKAAATAITSALTSNGYARARALTPASKGSIAGARVPQRLYLTPTPTALILDKTGTSNTILGISTSADTTLPTPVDPTKIVAFGPENLTARYFALITT